MKMDGLLFIQHQRGVKKEWSRSFLMEEQRPTREGKFKRWKNKFILNCVSLVFEKIT